MNVPIYGAACCAMAGCTKPRITRQVYTTDDLQAQPDVKVRLCLSPTMLPLSSLNSRSQLDLTECLPLLTNTSNMGERNARQSQPQKGSN